MIARHNHDQPKMPGEGGAWKREKVKVPWPELTTIEANDALYEMSNGCKEGVFISTVSNRSFFRQATPPVPHQSFLVSANGQALDKFGMGMNAKYAADRVSYQDLFLMTKDLYGNVEFETCADGKVTKHTAPMDWRPEYGQGVTFVDEPYIDEEDK